MRKGSVSEDVRLVAVSTQICGEFVTRVCTRLDSSGRKRSSRIQDGGYAWERRWGSRRRRQKAGNCEASRKPKTRTSKSDFTQPNAVADQPRRPQE